MKSDLQKKADALVPGALITDWYNDGKPENSTVISIDENSVVLLAESGYIYTVKKSSLLTLFSMSESIIVS